MKIAILGSGNIGGGLGRAWRKKGHAVVLGARDPSDPELGALASETGATLAPVADAPKGADVANAVERGAGGMALRVRSSSKKMGSGEVS